MKSLGMTESAIVFPLLPGRREMLTAFIAELSGARRDAHQENHASVQRESWFFQPTPQGDLVIVYLQAQDPMEVFVDLAVSQTPFALWFRQQALELTGVDLALLPPFSLPLRLLHWQRGEDSPDAEECL